MKSAPLLAALLVTLVAGIIIGRFTGSSPDSTRALEAELVEARQRIAELEAGAKPLASAEVREPIATDSSEAIQPPTSPAAPSSLPGTEGTPSLQGLADMMENPVMKDMMRQQMKGQISGTFAQLFRDQGFSEEEIEALSEVLLDRQVAMVEASMKAMRDAAGDPEKLKQMGDDIAAVKKEFDEQLEALLGESHFDEFERFEQTQGERQQIESLRTQLAQTENPLSDTQEQQLMDIMWDVRQDPKWQSAGAGEIAGMMQGSGAFPADTDKAIESYTAMQQDIRDRASAFLAPEQVQALEKNQGAFLDMMKMGMEMGKQMMGVPREPSR